ncbi:hypothetical protein [Thioalkalivibrio sp. ALgr3]|uniref:hypothetical protein n=1 Tax=Thioalkalivibrio sp. ALgr3 TaxID=1239292 RepID=UPI00037C4ED5|nr:hypothetical protein [Thioalkalivibrio sp. ALgr3]
MDTTIEQLQASLRDCRGTWAQVCEDTGLNYWWLMKFAQGRISNPGYDKVQRLQRYFSRDGEAA